MEEKLDAILEILKRVEQRQVSGLEGIGKLEKGQTEGLEDIKEAKESKPAHWSRG